MFGAGGGTSSYREVEETDLVILWGSNAREAHPIFFHHVLKAIRRGAKLVVVDPRRTPSAAWADVWLPVRVGHDIALANSIAHVLVTEGLHHRAFLARATVGFEALRDHLQGYSPEAVASATGIDPATIRRVARMYAAADRAVLCWTLGITEHHNAVDNVLALINLALLTGHVGRWGSGVNPLRGQNNVQGGGDMGALPHKLPGFQDVEDPAARGRYEALWGAPIPPKKGWTITEMFEAMGRGDLKALYCLGENPAQSEADSTHAVRRLQGLDHLVVQDLFLTRTAEMAHVVLPATAAWCESEGTVTNSERRVQRVRKAVEAPPGVRDDLDILAAVSARLGHPLGDVAPMALWDEMRTHSPMHHGMRYDRLEALGGIPWPCPHEDHPGTPFLHAWLWDEPFTGRPAPLSVVHDEGPVEALSPEYPLRLTTGRHLDSFNTGAQSGALASPLRCETTVDLSPRDAHALGLADGTPARIVSRRGSVLAPVRVDPRLPVGLVFMTWHDPDVVDTNALTIEATDPRSGTAEFKAAAVRVEPLRGNGPSPFDAADAEEES